ncbi:MAG: sigma 54-interacting transcriptional regulator [Terracidiphilus sp.]|nr:sigma 54-interacting transcriptional regulator [Terracidiphilus sp.]MDR3776202.1 sigma 54-interacting transcriptional regulator [Terracidiphilus sp.]
MGIENLDSRDGSRYRALLGVSTAIASQPDVQAVLGSIAALLSKVVPFDSIALLLLNQQNQTTLLYALEAGKYDPGIKIGTEAPFKNTAVASVLEQQKPVFVPDIRQEWLKIPQFAPIPSSPIEGVLSSFIFPVSSSRRKLGVLIFGAVGRGQYSDADVELMGSFAAHISIALESALALDAAEAYRQELERERDRLNLLLEINNHIITHLDVNELFQAASISIRDYFKNVYTGFWLFEEGSNQLQCITFDFPGTHGCLHDIPAPMLKEEELAKFRSRVPSVFGKEEIEAWPNFQALPFRSESIISIASVPLVGSTNPLGMISLGSRQKDAFSQSDLDLLAQVSNQIALALENALAFGRLNVSRNRLEDERLYLESEIQSEYNFEDIIGSSPALRKALDQVSIVAPTDSTVLLVGETGTGKELIARAIHNLNARRDRTFVRLNCSAIPSGLLESELFGYEKGAFTGALAQKRGRIELAHEGSLFLDEIGDINLDLQPKLLRVLQEREFERLGSNRTVKVNVRLIAATNRDLLDMVHTGQFREDLFYRLNVFPIHILPLRERKEDIPLLVHYFVSLLSRKMRKSIRVIPCEAMEAMVNWSWPGNVRELQNFVERSVILSRGETLAAPISELRRKGALKKSPTPSVKLHATDREAIVQALRAAQGRISGAGGAAEQLGLKRTTLQKRMARLEISRLEYS